MANPLSSYLLTLEPTFDVLSAYASDNVTLPATVGAAWVAIGGFKTVSAVMCRLQVTGLAAPTCTLKVALFDVSKIADSQVEIISGGDVTQVSKTITLDGQKTYIIAASCEASSAGAANFGVARTVSLTAP